MSDPTRLSEAVIRQSLVTARWVRPASRKAAKGGKINTRVTDKQQSVLSAGWICTRSGSTSSATSTQIELAVLRSLDSATAGALNSSSCAASQSHTTVQDS